MNNISAALVLAEQIADRHGDSYWYKNDYVLLREYNGILASMEGALKNQGLWGIFQAQCDPVWFSEWFSTEI